VLIKADRGKGLTVEPSARVVSRLQLGFCSSPKRHQLCIHKFMILETHYFTNSWFYKFMNFMVSSAHASLQYPRRLLRCRWHEAPQA
jgi:hypothetical protein